jgi:hypothetical protein
MCVLGGKTFENEHRGRGCTVATDKLFKFCHLSIFPVDCICQRKPMISCAARRICVTAELQ